MQTLRHRAVGIYNETTAGRQAAFCFWLSTRYRRRQRGYLIYVHAEVSGDHHYAAAILDRFSAALSTSASVHSTIKATPAKPAPDLTKNDTSTANRSTSSNRYYPKGTTNKEIHSQSTTQRLIPSTSLVERDLTRGMPLPRGGKPIDEIRQTSEWFGEVLMKLNTDWLSPSALPMTQETAPHQA